MKVDLSKNNLAMAEWFIKHKVSTALMSSNEAIAKAIDNNYKMQEFSKLKN